MLSPGDNSNYVIVKGHKVLVRHTEVTLEVAAVDINTLPKLPYADRGNLPDARGIYFVMVDSRPYYIGRAKSIRKRHNNPDHPSCRSWEKRDAEIAWHLCENIDELEKAFLSKFEPKGNYWKGGCQWWPDESYASYVPNARSVQQSQRMKEYWRKRKAENTNIH